MTTTAEQWSVESGEGITRAVGAYDQLLIDFMSLAASATAQSTVHIPTESLRVREARMLTHRFATVAIERPRVLGVWLSQAAAESLVTVVVRELDDALEFQLREVFDGLAAHLPDPSVARLFVYDDEDDSEPEGDLVVLS